MFFSNVLTNYTICVSNLSRHSHASLELLPIVTTWNNRFPFYTKNIVTVLLFPFLASFFLKKISPHKLVKIRPGGWAVGRAGVRRHKQFALTFRFPLITLSLVNRCTHCFLGQSLFTNMHSYVIDLQMTLKFNIIL